MALSLIPYHNCYSPGSIVSIQDVDGSARVSDVTSWFPPEEEDESYIGKCSHIEPEINYVLFQPGERSCSRVIFTFCCEVKSHPQLTVMYNCQRLYSFMTVMSKVVPNSCLFQCWLSTETHLGPDGTRLQQNA